VPHRYPAVAFGGCSQVSTLEHPPNYYDRAARCVRLITQLL
jgi:hypothetical protein